MTMLLQATNSVAATIFLVYRYLFVFFVSISEKIIIFVVKIIF